jgi:L-seryl-tRNA(Ser) seleniumtransferase
MEPRLPSVDKVLRHPAIEDLRAQEGTDRTRDLVRSVLAEHRARGESPSVDDVVAELVIRATGYSQPSLRAVVNATGVIIHTNLGRAPLSSDALAAMEAVGGSYSNLEFDLEIGSRGSRSAHVEDALIAATGAEAAIAVNNNASALLLVLSTLCRDREVIISRGQAVEIGGGFRIPDIMSQSGVRLVEVGTTNRTYIADYEEAIGDDTSALIRVHASNFRITGFTTSVTLADLAALATSRRLLLLDDLGSGCLLDTRQFGLAPEPTVQESVRAGADLVMFSGDKLLGGPQAGIIVGRRRLVQMLKKHPLARALRMDKASIAALSATLAHYRRGEALTRIPIWRMVAADPAQIERRAKRWLASAGGIAALMSGRSMIGGGSLPEESLPTTLLAIPEAEGVRPNELGETLRLLPRPIVGRIAQGRLLLDPRTVDPTDDKYVSHQLHELSSEISGSS